LFRRFLMHEKLHVTRYTTIRTGKTLEALDSTCEEHIPTTFTTVISMICKKYHEEMKK
jgi:hypothetical protein